MQALTKTCSKCGEEKPRTEFNKNKAQKDGLQNNCKSCHAEQVAKYREKNVVERVEHDRKYREKNKDKIAAYRKENKGDIAAQKARYYQKNKEKNAARSKAWYEKNKNKVKIRHKEWAAQNRHKKNASLAKRRSAQLEATPPWLTTEDFERIEDFYRLANLMTSLGLGEWHVDHIVPLQGREVKGLHVPWNLRVMPAAQNLSKGNKLAA